MSVVYPFYLGDDSSGPIYWTGPEGNDEVRVGYVKSEGKIAYTFAVQRENWFGSCTLNFKGVQSSSRHFTYYSSGSRVGYLWDFVTISEELEVFETPEDFLNRNVCDSDEEDEEPVKFVGKNALQTLLNKIKERLKWAFIDEKPFETIDDGDFYVTDGRLKSKKISSFIGGFKIYSPVKVGSDSVATYDLTGGNPIVIDDTKYNPDYKKPWKIHICFSPAWSISKTRYAFTGSYGSNNKNPSFQLQPDANRIWFGYSVGGSSWDTVLEVPAPDLEEKMPTGTWHILDAGWTGSELFFTIHSSLGVLLYSGELAVSSPQYQQTGNFLVIGNNINGSIAFLGKVNLYDTYIENDGIRIWGSTGENGGISKLDVVGDGNAITDLKITNDILVASKGAEFATKDDIPEISIWYEVNHSQMGSIKDGTMPDEVDTAMKSNKYVGIKYTDWDIWYRYHLDFSCESDDYTLVGETYSYNKDTNVYTNQNMIYYHVKNKAVIRDTILNELVLTSSSISDRYALNSSYYTLSVDKQLKSGKYYALCILVPSYPETFTFATYMKPEPGVDADYILRECNPMTKNTATNRWKYCVIDHYMKDGKLVESRSAELNTLGSEENVHLDHLSDKQVLSYDAENDRWVNRTIWYPDNITAYISEKNTIYSATLAAGATNVTITNDKITTNSIIDTYFETTGVYAPIYYDSIEVVNGAVTIHFEPMKKQVTVGIRIS